MSHIKHLEIIAAMLEDHNPGLTVLGIDYAKKTEELRAEGEEIERKLKEKEALLEANTITLSPTPVSSMNSEERPEFAENQSSSKTFSSEKVSDKRNV